MKKERIDHTTGFPGIYNYDPTSTSSRYYIQFRNGINPRTKKPITIKRMVDRDGSKITSLKRAKEFLTELKKEAEQDKMVNYDNHMLYSDFMTDYIQSYKTDVQSSTFKRAEGSFHLFIEWFGSLALKDITVNQVSEFRTWLLTSKNEGGSGYAQSTAAQLFGMFRKTLDYAVTLDYLQVNVSKKVKAIPKGKATVLFWSKNQFEQVIAQIYIEEYYQHLNFVMLWIYFTTGVRVNEGCALYWEDIDFVKKQMSIQHTLEIKNKDNWNRKDSTKTENGKRIISLDDTTISILLNWQKRQQKECTSQFIFSYAGKPMQKSTIGRIIKRYAELANVTKIQTKGLRHSHASYLINEFNVDILLLSKRLGHSSPEITLKHYSHLYPNRDQEIANFIDGNISVKTSNKNNIKFNGNQVIH